MMKIIAVVMFLIASVVSAEWMQHTRIDPVTMEMQRFVIGMAIETHGVKSNPHLVFSEFMGEYHAMIGFEGDPIHRDTTVVLARIGADIYEIPVYVDDDSMAIFIYDPLDLMFLISRYSHFSVRVETQNGDYMLGIWDMDGFYELLQWATWNLY